MQVSLKRLNANDSQRGLIESKNRATDKSKTQCQQQPLIGTELLDVVIKLFRKFIVVASAQFTHTERIKD